MIWRLRLGGAEKTLKAGRHRELTGDMPAVGTSCKMRELAVNEVNAAPGGLPSGKEKMKVQLVVEDNAGKGW